MSFSAINYRECRGGNSKKGLKEGETRGMAGSDYYNLLIIQPTLMI